MEPWLIHSLIAVIALGSMQALYKVPASKGHNKYLYSLLSFFVATIISVIFFYRSFYFDARMMWFGAIWGTGYALLVLLQMEILKKLDSSIAFPITSLASHVLVVIIGLSFFNDQLSLLQIIAIIITFIIVGLYNYTKKHITISNGLIPIATGIVLLSTFNKFIQKSGSTSGDLNTFIFWQLFFATIASGVILLINRSTVKKENLIMSKGIIIWAIILGILNFVGTAEIVKALSTGPFSLVYTVNSFYILISSLIAWKLFGEKLTRSKLLFVGLAIITIILIKIG